jgi:hypothetical protein
LPTSGCAGGTIVKAPGFAETSADMENPIKQRQTPHSRR